MMITLEMKEKVSQASAMIANAKRIVIFTGAGVSTESGIPDFRSPGGLWTKFDPEDFTIDKYLSNPETRKKQWRFLFTNHLLIDAIPNDAHKAIAELEALGCLDCVITQNIDNLHQKAGNDPSRIFELHGNMKWMRCLECGKRSLLEEIRNRSGAEDDLPACRQCKGMLKPDVIFFGEALPEETLREATYRANHCDLLIVVGSSLAVYPAANMPYYAKQSGAKLVIINLTPTPADRSADIVIHASAGETMKQLLDSARKRIA
jgi:NAD-dependent deacetylase